MSAKHPLPPIDHVGHVGYVGSLDLLRFGAAFAVLLYHYLYRGAAIEPMSDVAFEGGAWVRHLYLAVHLFFAISGFVIMASVRDRDALSFAAARFVRLWPAYVICASITLGVVWVLNVHGGGTRFPASAGQWAANLTFLAPAFGQPFADGAYWTIVVELVFYAWVAVMILARVLPRHTLPFAAAWLAVAATNELWLGSGALRALAATVHAPWFVFGMVVHHFVARGHSRLAWVVALAAVALSMHNVAAEQVEIALGYGEEPDRAGIAVANGFVLILFALAVQFRGLLRPTPMLVALGAMTYPLYLLHQNLGYIALDRLTPELERWLPGFGKHAALALAILGILALAWIVERALDRPARRWLRRMVDAVLTPFDRMVRRAA